MTRILLIEDDALIAEIIGDELTRHGYQVTVGSDGASGLAAFTAHEPALVLLDLVLPDRDGLDLLTEMRARSAAVPIVILTSRSAGGELVEAFRRGADDYVTKPFRPDELIERIRARLRRPGTIADGSDTRGFGRVSVDFRARTVDVGGEAAHLTPTEFKLLEQLLRREGSVVKREQLIEALVGGEEGTEQALHTQISRLRRKLGADGGRIGTVWGVGYRLEPEPKRVAG